jgi:hypothetical protein
MKIISLICMTIIASSLQALADESISKSSGEVCILPDQFPIEGVDYSKTDAKMEKKLCSYDFNIASSSEDSKAVALCPKLFSTYPAVELLEIPEGEIKSDIEANSCNEKVGTKNREYSKVAKYKQSMSCAKTPSIIGYYHVSRALGLDMVPVSVLRTMDKATHLKVAEKGVKFSKSAPGDLIAKNWVTITSMIKSSNSAISTDDGKFTIGALSENPRGEQKYYEDFYPNASGLDGVKNFKNTGLYKKLITNKPVHQIVGTDLTTANYTSIRQMKDAADMIVLDTLFGQQDRFGNVHSLHTFMVREGDDLKKLTMTDIEELIKKDGTDEEKKDLKKAKSMPSDWKKEVVARNILLLKIAKSYFDRKSISYAHAQEILLKDNDCGLKGSNVFKSTGLINNVRHISESTYSQLLKIHQKVSSGELETYAAHTLFMDSNEFEQFKGGLNHVVEQLNAKCAAGELFLDLNVKSHFLGKNQSDIQCGTSSNTSPVPKADEKTTDGFPIYTVINSDTNIRTAWLEQESAGVTDASKLVLDGIAQQSRAGDRVAVLGYTKAGNSRFAKIRVIESNHLPNDVVLYIWDKALNL